MNRECPICGSEMMLVEDEPDVGIVAHWYCVHCDKTFEVDYDEGA